MKKIIISVVVILFLFFCGLIAFYLLNVNATFGKNEEVIVEIEKGSSSNKIAQKLENSKLVSSWVFKLYCKFNKVEGMKAGTYKLNKSMKYFEIVDSLKKGSKYNPDAISVKFVEGKNMSWIAKNIAQYTNNTEEQVYALLKDKKYLASLSQKYWFIGNEVLNDQIYYSLEGYLFPDTYQLDNKNVSVEKIFEMMLDRMNVVLTKHKAQIQNSGLSVHSVLTLASIVELESSNVADRAGVAGVFFNRLTKGMSLGSDVTTYYAARVDMSERDLKMSEINSVNGYNTRATGMEGKIPIGPIAMVSESSIVAVLQPLKTNYLFFVADKNGKVYYANTNQEHEQIIKNLKSQGLWYTY